MPTYIETLVLGESKSRVWSLAEKGEARKQVTKFFEDLDPWSVLTISIIEMSEEDYNNLDDI